TYGTRLHGDPRGTVDRKHNEFGSPILGYDQHRWEREKSLLKFPPVVLTREEMLIVESIIPWICERGSWKYITCAAGPDHVHVIVRSPRDPETIRRLMKRWLGQELSKRLNKEPNRPQSGTPEPDRPQSGTTWWAECGSIKWIDNERYLKNATEYVTRQRATRPD
ncbi:MAG: hypothetical protein ACREJC_07175, partial [Tepidisphaeraceae bacterium]